MKKSAKSDISRRSTFNQFAEQNMKRKLLCTNYQQNSLMKDAPKTWVVYTRKYADVSAVIKIVSRLTPKFTKHLREIPN